MASIVFITLLVGLSFIYYRFKKWEPVAGHIVKRAEELYKLETLIMTKFLKECGLDEDFYNDRIPELIYEASQSQNPEKDKIDLFLILASDANINSDFYFHKQIDIVGTHFKNNEGSIGRCSNFLESISSELNNVSYILSDQRDLNEMRAEGTDLIKQCLTIISKCKPALFDEQRPFNCEENPISDVTSKTCFPLWMNRFAFDILMANKIQFYLSLKTICDYHPDCTIGDYVDLESIEPYGYRSKVFRFLFE